MNVKVAVQQINVHILFIVVDGYNFYHELTEQPFFILSRPEKS
jgi:hypothetical protein